MCESQQGPHILLVEDDPLQARLFQEALRHHAPWVSMTHVPTAEDGLTFLEGGRSGASLVVLDLHLPGMSGFEFLALRRTVPALVCLPVAVFSSSDSADDIRVAYALGANCYIIKPMGYLALRNVIAQLERFWFGLAERPGQSCSSLPGRLSGGTGSQPAL